jgi:hypothetical protein
MPFAVPTRLSGAFVAPGWAVLTLSTNRAFKTQLGRDGHLVHADVADVHVPFQRYGVHAGEVVVVQRGSSRYFKIWKLSRHPLEHSLLPLHATAARLR